MSTGSRNVSLGELFTAAKSSRHEFLSEVVDSARVVRQFFRRELLPAARSIRQELSTTAKNVRQASFASNTWLQVYIYNIYI